MSLWTANNVANNVPNIPKYVHQATLNSDGDTTKVFGLSANTTLAANVAGVAHPGWVYVTKGKGGVTSIAVANGGVSYTNGDAVVFANTHGSGGAGAVVTSNTGVIVSVTITAPGLYDTAPVLTISSNTGSNGALTATASGGRFGRRQIETLVAMGSMTSNGAAAIP